MIEISNVSKTFGDVRALKDVSLKMKEGEFFGLIGTNGAGKSTLLRLLSGVLKPDRGEVLIDGENVYNNSRIKNHIFFIPDDPFFYPNSVADDLADFYYSTYIGFDKNIYKYYMEELGLTRDRKISTFSKGMKRQLSLIIGVASQRKYIVCDETFDGLDPVMRQAVKAMFAKEMADHEMTPILSSHNLRELEDVCNHVGLLHRGGVLLSKDLEEMKCNIQKVQCVFRNDKDAEKINNRPDIILHEKRGKVHIYTVRGERDEVDQMFKGMETVFYELLALSLEEIFISETEVVGYDIKKCILG